MQVTNSNNELPCQLYQRSGDMVILIALELTFTYAISAYHH